MAINAGLSNPEPIHEKKEKQGNNIPVDFVQTSNNHHVAIFVDEQGHLQEHIVSFYEANSRAIQGLPVIEKDYNSELGWNFLFTLKQNEYFVFPDIENGFNPKDIDLTNVDNYVIISPHLYRVQKLTSKDYFFRHHLETTVENNNALKETTWKRITAIDKLANIVKVRVNHIGQIVAVGEY